MDYKIFIYIFMLFATTFAFSGINFNNIFKTNHVIEAKIFVMILVLGFSYISSKFIIELIECM